jgi:4'-phosphopantetheinyl transferase
VLSDALGVDPAGLRYERSCEHCGHPTHGRPRLAGPEPALDFSLSHSGAAVVVAVGPGPLGVDVEDLTRRPVAAGVVERVTTTDERDALPAAGVPGRHRAVLELWTRKEAVGKALGLGVTLAFGGFAAPVGRVVTAGPAGGHPLVVWPVEVPGAVASVAVAPDLAVAVVDG